VIGADGGDTLIGGALNDMLVAGSGRQVMSGGAGADIFVFGKPGIQAEIRDFTPGVDQLRFEAPGDFGITGPADWQISQLNGQTTVLFGGDAVTLLGVTAQQLRPGDIGVV
jgi:hypothetical protein